MKKKHSKASDPDRVLRHPKTALTGRTRAAGAEVQVSGPDGLTWVKRTLWDELVGVTMKAPLDQMPEGYRRRAPIGNGQRVEAAPHDDV